MRIMLTVIMLAAIALPILAQAQPRQTRCTTMCIGSSNARTCTTTCY